VAPGRIAVRRVAAAPDDLRAGGVTPVVLADGSLAVPADLASGLAVVRSGR
jgi:hypothetical protein